MIDRYYLMEDKNRFELKKLSSISKWDSLYEKTKQIYASPIYLEATVEHGFKRGSKDLGIPTANMSMSQLGNDGESLKTGIYFGYSCIKGKVYESVTSVGWNPYFKNEKKTVEVHILSKLDDFYDENIITLLCGYLREEADFDSLGLLF